ncbi:MAG: hypothetical protein N2Z79_01570 [Candidatus Omnitrophica bacterium]|nr:hypothetical protein [Candidatus Omnitrophota bacterium]
MERRRIYFIEKRFQTNFIFKFFVLVFLGAIIFAGIIYILSRHTSTVTFLHGKAKILSTADFLFPILIQTIVVVTVVISLFGIILTLFISHKIAGPLYRLKKALESIGRGEIPSNFCFRKKDQLQDLAVSVSIMVKELKGKISDLKRDWEELKRALPEGLKDKVQKIDNNLDYFKID